MYRELLEKNAILEDDIVSVMFTVTADLTALNPATALRQAGFGKAVALFAAAEPCIANSLPRVIRVLVTYYGSKKPVPVYLNGAEMLRPDLGNGAQPGAER